MEDASRRKRLAARIKEVTDVCMRHVDKNRDFELMSYLQSQAAGNEEQLAISDLVDKDGYTLLHMACFKNKTRTVHALLNRAKQELTPQ